ncbi:MAG: pyridoxamine 5'-phosphate oxidase [Gemmataceae bacterium]
MNLADLRREYMQKGFSEEQSRPDPFEQFGVWLEEALAVPLLEPNAMTLATCSADGKPTARVVLLRGFDGRGFTFFTNRHSGKGRQLAENPQACLVLFWPEMDRQIRIEGHVEWTSDEESEVYFASRPRGSQLAAWASRQSEVIPNRAALEQRVEEFAIKYAEQAVPRPPHWGGYRVVPAKIEFWQGRPSRLHDRLRYRKGTDGKWIRERLAP